MHFIFISFKMHRKGYKDHFLIFFKALLKVFIKNLFEAVLSFCRSENIAYKNPFSAQLSMLCSFFYGTLSRLWQQWYGILHTLRRENGYSETQPNRTPCTSSGNH